MGYEAKGLGYVESQHYNNVANPCQWQVMYQMFKLLSWYANPMQNYRDHTLFDEIIGWLNDCYENAGDYGKSTHCMIKMFATTWMFLGHALVA